MEGLAGSDRLYGLEGNDSISGGVGDDTLSGGLGNDSLDGGAGNDWANYSASQTAVTVNLLTGVATGEGADVLNGIENIAGSNFGDELWGDDLPNFIGGNGGDDTLNGGAGNDTLDGDEGADHLQGGDGDDVLLASLDADTLDGGAGRDQLSFESLWTGIEFNLANKSVTALTSGQDSASVVTHQLTLVSIEHIKGSSFADVLIGDANHNTLTGGIGNDTLYGGAGDDVLYGDSDASWSASGGNRYIFSRNCIF
jgi:Ca2+-binding RTX toxin-like protein